MVGMTIVGGSGVSVGVGGGVVGVEDGSFPLSPAGVGEEVGEAEANGVRGVGVGRTPHSGLAEAGPAHETI